MFNEETVASENVFRGSLISVRRDTVRLSGGRTGTREIVEHPPVVAMAAVDGDGRLVMVRQYRKAVERELLEIPAGSVEKGETLEEAVRREMVEETGLVPARIEPMATVYPTPGVSTEVMHLFRVENLAGDGMPSEPVDELVVERIEVEEARRMIASGAIVDAKSVVAVMMLKSRSLHNEERGG